MLFRSREVLKAEPQLAKTVDDDESTLLMWLPEDEMRAMEIARILMDHGVDPAVRNRKGRTAADYARGRGLYEVAGLLSRSTTGLKA